MSKYKTGGDIAPRPTLPWWGNSHHHELLA